MKKPDVGIHRNDRIMSSYKRFASCAQPTCVVPASVKTFFFREIESCVSVKGSGGKGKGGFPMKATFVYI